MRIAIVSAVEKDRKSIADFIGDICGGDVAACAVSAFRDDAGMLKDGEAAYDVYYLGASEETFALAGEIRRADKGALIVFVGDGGDAVRGYACHAFDYLVRPLRFAAFRERFADVAEAVRVRPDFVVIRNGGRAVRMSPAKVRYVESRGHYLEWHTRDSVATEYGRLSDVEARLAPDGFFRINKGCLVNLGLVEGVDESEVTLLGGERLTVAHTRRRELMERFTGQDAGAASRPGTEGEG